MTVPDRSSIRPGCAILRHGTQSRRYAKPGELLASSGAGKLERCKFGASGLGSEPKKSLGRFLLACLVMKAKRRGTIPSWAKALARRLCVASTANPEEN
jgi:hypothetical protein